MEQERYFLVQGGLILFQSEKVVSSFRMNLRGQVRLTAHGIDANQAPAKVEQSHQGGNGCDFIGGGVHLGLSQDQAGFCGKRTYDVNRVFFRGRVKAVPYSFSIDSDLSEFWLIRSLEQGATCGGRCEGRVSIGKNQKSQRVRSGLS